MSILYDTQTNINKMVLCHEQQIKDIAEHLLKLKIKRKWVGLTLDDIPDLAVSKDWIDGARWAATLLWEKNND